MATVLLAKPIIIPPREYGEPPTDLGVVTITDEGVMWHLNKQLVYKSTWEMWALTMSTFQLSSLPGLTPRQIQEFEGKANL